MKARFLPLALIAVLVLAFGAVAAACGDDGDNGNGNGNGEELTLAEYFDKLQTLSVRFDEQGRELEEEFDLESAESDEEAIDLAEDFFRGDLSVIQDFVDDLDDLNPPAEVEDAHNDTVEAGEEAVSAFEGVVEQVGEAESMADLGAIFAGLGTDPFDAFSEACLTLQGIADDNNIAVDLRCG